MDNKTPPLSLSSHSKFFTSLKQVEKRLKLDHTSPAPIENECQIQESNFSSSRESLISPMFLHLDQTIATQSSEPPQPFLSISQDFPPTQTTPSHNLTTVNNPHENDDDDIEQLMQLLGLSEEENDGFYEDGSDCNSCDCESGFYSKVVGVEGPKCGKEVKRLNGWIKHFMNGGGEEEKVEPLRLAHLLLGKATFISKGADADFGGLEFPSTIQEFLHTNPPTI
ncbi:hypothetical protein Lal_00043274 [Lupinus albus]|uniref:Uncharacterized protein n=1 Tax=Lupinus albus TaxID=3870 RepID=A0A6A5PGP7_LUPAL|nr:hypothetical protein Lalb_Chr03g0037351 [Lupinus albus]KAF1896324.1 hypothetical protein Lal_00043274 [Lupinus albus]